MLVICRQYYQLPQETNKQTKNTTRRQVFATFLHEPPDPRFCSFPFSFEGTCFTPRETALASINICLK